MKELKSWSIIGAVFSAAAGILLHFVYDWFGGSLWAILGAVNESTWEHLKLLFWPVAIFAILEYLAYGRQMAMFVPAKLLSVLAGMGTIVILFYTYSGILGYNVAAIDILIFFIGVAVAYLVSYFLLKGWSGTEGYEKGIFFAGTVAFAGFVALAILFVVFTAEPPHLGLFRDPVTGGYGS